MLLSVIIVNYNVKYFLEHCLLSVQKAGSNMQMEVIVVDNHSSDNSRDYLLPLFPTVRFVWLIENAGFSKACNIGLQQASGQYILFLNPDTIVPEDCFEKCIHFLSLQTQPGALGVRMTDGNGTFLKESKRGYPSLLASFFRFSGLIALFPHSRLFAHYYLGHLPETSINNAEVLSGAFMLIPQEVLAVTGSFDERFFMYGEDIDLSYRIQQAGYHNYYYPGVTIIHFKGESTEKNNVSYLRTFFNAMYIFIRKHYTSGRSVIYRLGVTVVMLASMIMTVCRNFFSPPRKMKAGDQLKDIFILGTESEYKAVAGIMQQENDKVHTSRLEKLPVGISGKEEYEADLIICEGNLSFKEIIDQVPALASKYRVWFRASGSRSVITSNSKNARGTTIPHL